MGLVSPETGGWSFSTRGDFQAHVGIPGTVSAHFRRVYGYVGNGADEDKMSDTRPPVLFLRSRTGRLEILSFCRFLLFSVRFVSGAKIRALGIWYDPSRAPGYVLSRPNPNRSRLTTPCAAFLNGGGAGEHDGSQLAGGDGRLLRMDTGAPSHVPADRRLIPPLFDFLGKFRG